MDHPPFAVEIITPEGTEFSGQVRSLKLPGLDGSFGILSRHAPMLAALDIGEIEYTAEDSSRHRMAVGEGFVEVHREGARVLTDFANDAAGIDSGRAEAAEQRAQERLGKRASRFP